MLGTLFLGAFGCAAPDASTAHESSVARRIHDDYGVSILSDPSEESYLPESWRRAPVYAAVEPVASEDVPRIAGLVEAFLSRYPTDVVRAHLRRVVVARRLVFYGRAFGGTNSRDAIYVTDRGATAGFTDAYLLELLHAEFSSILLRLHPSAIDAQAFRAANPEGFDYHGTGVEMLGRPDVHRADERLHAAGFLSLYATSSFENDVNAYAAWLMIRPSELARLAARHAAVAEKKEIVSRFFTRLGVDVDAARRDAVPAIPSRK